MNLKSKFSTWIMDSIAVVICFNLHSICNYLLPLKKLTEVDRKLIENASKID
jgi:hypothetical protein